MHGILVLLSEKHSRKRLAELFEADLVFSKSGAERYSRETAEGRYYIDFDADIIRDYSQAELDMVPYKVCDVCHITYYPPAMISGITDKLMEYDSDVFADDDHGNIMSIAGHTARLSNDHHK